MNYAELRKNVEGYADPTASTTLSRREPREIWSYMSGRCLVIKNHGCFSTILMLGDEKRYPDDVEIETENGVYYANPRKLTWGAHNKMYGYLDSISVEVFESVLGAVGEKLGIELACNGKTDWPGAALQSLDEIEAQVQEIQADRAHLQKENEFLRARVAELTDLHRKAVDRVNETNIAKLKVVNQLELLQGMVGSMLARFTLDTED